MFKSKKHQHITYYMFLFIWHSLNDKLQRWRIDQWLPGVRTGYGYNYKGYKEAPLCSQNKVCILILVVVTQIHYYIMCYISTHNITLWSYVHILTETKLNAYKNW